MFQDAVTGKKREIIKYLLSIGAEKELNYHQLRRAINCLNVWWY